MVFYENFKMCYFIYFHIFLEEAWQHNASNSKIIQARGDPNPINDSWIEFELGNGLILADFNPNHILFFFFGCGLDLNGTSIGPTLCY